VKPDDRKTMSNLGNFVWGIADQLRGVYRPSQYGNVILPMTILRRLDCVLEATRDQVRALAEAEARPEVLDVKVRRQFGLHNKMADNFFTDDKV